MHRLTVVGMLVAACGTTTLDASRYDRSCAEASDCTVVYLGEMCATCACPNTAVNVKEQSRYAADAKAARATCPSAGLCEVLCPPRTATCTSGSCGLTP